MEILIYKKPNITGFFKYQESNGKTIECGCFKTYEDAISYADSKGYTKLKHNGSKFIVFEYVPGTSWSQIGDYYD